MTTATIPELITAVEYKIDGITFRDAPSTPDKLIILLELIQTVGGHPEAEAVTLLVHEDSSVWPVECDIDGCVTGDIQFLADGATLACGDCRTARNLT